MFLFLIIVFNSSKAQVLTSKGISTNPDNPINPENSDFDNIDYFFDWREPDNGWDYYVDNWLNYDKIQSPFFIMALDHPFYNQAYGINSDFQPDDGWELLKFNLGYKMDGTTRLADFFSPYILLYNKYSSTLRFFIANTPNSDWQTVAVEIFIEDPALINYNAFYSYSALLSNNNNVAQVLSDSTEIVKVQVPTKHPNNPMFFWLDIPIAYDPCVCYNYSHLHIDLSFYNKSDIYSFRRNY